jgi:hypothetical protein
LLATAIAVPRHGPEATASDGHTHAAIGSRLPVPVTASVAAGGSGHRRFRSWLPAIEGKHLVVYLDRFASNEPVDKSHCGNRGREG